MNGKRTRVIHTDPGDVIEITDCDGVTKRRYEIKEFNAGECRAYDLRYGHDLVVGLYLFQKCVIVEKTA